MNRRRFLATVAGAGLTVPVAGCTSPLARSLDREFSGAGEGELVVRFFDGDSEVATTSYDVGPPVDGQVRFRVSLSHDLEAVRSFRLRFKPITSSEDVAPRVLLERPGGYPYPPYRFQSGRGFGWTLFEVPDLQSQAEGTFTVQFWFGGVDDRVSVSTDLRAELDAGLDPRPRVAEAIATVEGESPNRG